MFLGSSDTLPCKPEKWTNSKGRFVEVSVKSLEENGKFILFCFVCVVPEYESFGNTPSTKNEFLGY